MPHKSYRQESKSDWGVSVSDNYKMNDEQLKLGALLRIADATELMAKNYLRLQADNEMLRRWHENEKAQVAKLQRQVNAYKGIVKKLKAKK